MDPKQPFFKCLKFLNMIRLFVFYSYIFVQGYCHALPKRALLCQNSPSVSLYFNPLKYGVGGAVRPYLPFSLPFTQNIMRQPIPENS